MSIVIGRELTERSAKGGALRSRPIEELILAGVAAARPPPGIAAAVEVGARDLASAFWQRYRPARLSAIISRANSAV
jgi:hypothetical protein